MTRHMLLVAALLSLGPYAAAGAAPPVGAPAPPAATAPANQATTTALPMRSVTLFSSGVGLFEHTGSVTDGATVGLRLKASQVNDVLKSLVVADPLGDVQGASYPSAIPLPQVLGSFQINLSSDPPLHELLEQSRGAAVSVGVGDEVLKGTVVGVEKNTASLPHQPPATVESWRLNLLTPEGLRSVPLDQVRRVELDDPALQADLQAALATLAQARNTQRKTLAVHFGGTGTRAVTVAYLLEAPVWKTSYRLVLPAQNHDTTQAAHGPPASQPTTQPAQLQAWAIVDNQTDQDWHQITLHLVGGHPISFVEDLYPPLYVPRPVVPPQVQASVAPPRYPEGLATDRGAALEEAAREPRAAVPAAAAAPMAFGASARTPSGLAVDALKQMAGRAMGQTIGPTFQYTLEHVSLPRQRSGLLPILTGQVQSQPVSIYNADVLARYPLLGVRLTNTLGKFLPAGPMTILATSGATAHYVGDAQLTDLPPGESRLVSYAVDQDLLADASKTGQTDQITTASLVKGVLHLRHVTEQSHTYEIQNKSGQPRTLILESPRLAGYRLAEPKAPLEKTDTLYRFQLGVPGHQTVSFVVRQDRVYGEQVALLPMDPGTIESYARSGQVPPKVQEALAKAAQMKQTVAGLQRQVDEKTRQRQELLAQQANTRENIKVLPAGSKSQEDQIRELTDREHQVTTMNQDLRDLQGQKDKVQKDLEDYLGALNVE